MKGEKGFWSKRDFLEGEMEQKLLTYSARAVTAAPEEQQSGRQIFF